MSPSFGNLWGLEGLEGHNHTSVDTLTGLEVTWNLNLSSIKV